MKKTMRVATALFALVMIVGCFAACGTTTPVATNAPAVSTTAGTEASTPFVAPPDQIGLVISADTQLVTWQPYETKEDTIDFKNVNLKSLGTAGEMSLVYMENEVTYYSLVTGTLEKATIEDVVVGSVVGVTTLEQGVMEVYILSVPTVESEVEADPLEATEVTIPAETTAATVADEDLTPDDSEVPEETNEGDGI